MGQKTKGGAFGGGEWELSAEMEDSLWVRCEGIMV